MGIREALESPKSTGGQPLLVGEVLDKMDPELRALAEQLLASEQSDGAVAEGFTDDGYPLSQGAVRNYRLAKRVGRFNK